MKKTAHDLSPADLAAMIDHTFLKAAGDPGAVKKLCAEARKYKFACAMVNPCEVPFAVKALKGSGVKVGTVIGFPLGQNTANVKGFEALEAIENGASEIDFVINVRLLKAAAAEVAKDAKSKKACAALDEELKGLAATVKTADATAVSKLIIETCYLTDDEKLLACKMAKAAGFDYVKTSTGFGTAGATVADVKLMRKAVGRAMGVKAAGGIRDLDTALALVKAGATRLGCSAGVEIVEALSRRIEKESK